jgi:hypothetical protein
LVNHLRCERWLHLSEFVRQCDIRSVATERRIDSHQKLWPIIAADPCQRRAHIQLERNLLEGLVLLHAQRAILLHELNGVKIPRKIAAPAQSHPHELSETDAVGTIVSRAQSSGPTACRTEHRCATSLPINATERSRELFQIKKQQLLPTGRPFLHDAPADLSGAPSPPFRR